MSGDGDEMRALVIDDCHDKMRKAVQHLQAEFAAVRSRCDRRTDSWWPWV